MKGGREGEWENGFESGLKIKKEGEFRIYSEMMCNEIEVEEREIE